MYLTITSTAPQATDLGYLLHKHPGRAQSFDLSVGQAHVFYPESTDERCTVALLLEVDPIALVRSKRFKADGFSLGQYVNDRPYAASSLLAVALSRVFKSAIAKRCDARPELVEAALPLEIHLPSLPCDGAPDLVQRLFRPLGWQVQADVVELDPTIPQWGDSRYADVTLSGTMLLGDALSHLYVLLPVLDNAKHYWVGDDEVDKLVRMGEGWLSSHPEKNLISSRYLAHQGYLVKDVTARLAEADGVAPEALDVVEPVRDVPLVRKRHEAVLREIATARAARIVDLGCGQGALLRELIDDPTIKEILGVDVSSRALEAAERSLHLDRMPDSKRSRLRLIQSSVTYRDERIAGFDAIVLMEVIEHIDPPRLKSLSQTVFSDARPRTVIVTTPNAEYNARYESLEHGHMRHTDHRFEWTREEFKAWADDVAQQRGYGVRYEPVGDEDPDVGSPTQMAVFTNRSGENS